MNQNKYYHGVLAMKTKPTAQLWPGLQVRKVSLWTCCLTENIHACDFYLGNHIEQSMQKNIYLSQAQTKHLRLKELIKKNPSTSHKSPHPQVFISHLIINLLAPKIFIFLNQVHKVWVILLLFKI